MEQVKTSIRQLIPITIRKANADDLRFVLHSWIRSFGQYANKQKFGLSEWLICKSFEKIIAKRIHEMEIQIACSLEDPTQILGYVASETVKGLTTLHFAYVKEFIRHEGICRRLLEQLPHPLRFHSFPGKAHFKDLIYNPFHLLGIYIDDPKENMKHDPIALPHAIPTY